MTPAKTNGGGILRVVVAIVVPCVIGLGCWAGGITATVSGLQADNKTTKQGIERIEAKLDKLIDRLIDAD